MTIGPSPHRVHSTPQGGDPAPGSMPGCGRGRSWVGAQPAVLERIAADVDELARARRVADLTTAAVRDDARAELRRRLAEPDLDFREFCRRTKTPASSSLQGERAWDAFQAERHRRGERADYPLPSENPFRQPQRWW